MFQNDSAHFNEEKLISIVIPAFNEEAGIERFHHEHLVPALSQQTGHSFEVIYVNDGSSDETLSILTELFEHDERIRVVNLSRNFGKEMATTAGISVSQGDATIIMDADGQHPPEIIGKFIAAWLEGAQVVVGIRQSNQQEGLVKRFGSKIFYRLMNSISHMQTVPQSTDYRLIDAEVRSEFLKLKEHNRFTRGLIDWLGFKRDFVEFDAPARIAGDATYSVGKLIKLALNSFTTMSLKPLFFFGYVGLLITCLSLIAGMFIGVEQLLLGDPLGLNFTGSAMLGVFIAFLVGILLTAQGIMAFYLSHIHAQTQGRPLFVIDRQNSWGLGSTKGD